MLSRRQLLATVVALCASPAFAGPRHRHRRRVRRRVRRRRIRRRVRWRAFGLRRLLVVPVAVAAGWELLVDDRVLLVQEVHADHLIATHAGGKPEKIEIAKEDTAENAKELEGSEYEVEEEVEEEVAA
jgi:hypothetical protein